MQSLLMSNELAGWLQMTVAILKRRQKMQLTLSLLALLYYECNVTSQPFRKIAFLNGIGKAGQDSKKIWGSRNRKKTILSKEILFGSLLHLHLLLSNQHLFSQWKMGL